MNETLQNPSIDNLKMFEMVTIQTKDISGIIRNSEGEAIGLMIGWPGEGTRKAYLLDQVTKKLENCDTFHIVQIIPTDDEDSTTFLVEEVL